MLGAMLLGLLARRLFPLTPISFASQFQCAFRFNSYIGLAIAAKLHGATGIAAMGLLAGGMVPLANLAAVGMLARHGETSVWRELARNPLFLATLAALAWNLAGLSLPVPAAQFLGRLAESAIALGRTFPHESDEIILQVFVIKQISANFLKSSAAYKARIAAFALRGKERPRASRICA
jgi:predicted permease